ncbi:MAG: hypothetical protein PHR35_14675 [Kiritimatiellae bacterium]|nr:hypothetical protein [Kiritimatiellia bacterium]
MAKAPKLGDVSSGIREDLDGAVAAIGEFDVALAAGHTGKQLTDPLDDCADHAKDVPKECRDLAKEYKDKPVDRRAVVHGKAYTIWARTEDEYAARVAALEAEA